MRSHNVYQLFQENFIGSSISLRGRQDNNVFYEEQLLHTYISIIGIHPCKSVSKYTTQVTDAKVYISLVLNSSVLLLS